MVDPPSVLTTHLTEVVRENMAELLSYAETQKLLDDLPREQQKLVADMIPSQITRGRRAACAAGLLAERVSIRDLPTILEGIQEACGGSTRAIPAIVGHVRARLARQISDSHTGPNGYIPLITLSPEWEAAFAEALTGPPEDRQLAMAPSRLQEFMQKLRGAFDTAAATGETPVLLTSAASAATCAQSSSGSGRPRRCWLRRRSCRGRGSARWARYECHAMRLKLYRAPAMAQAMARVRAELGPDALILGTRRVADGVEVTAAVEPDEPQRSDPALIAALQYHGVAASLQPAFLGFAPLPFDEPLVFVGPPGAGKTLTVARLATRLVMAGIKPLVITADGKRAGATEELAAFTKLLGINLIVACHPATLGRTVAQRSGPTLIDTPGCNPFDPASLEEMAALAAAGCANMVLVLPAGLDPAEATDLANAFVAAGCRHLVATRLDLAHRLGGVLAAAATGLALSEAGVGPGAADGLQPITPEWLTARLMTGPHA